MNFFIRALGFVYDIQYIIYILYYVQSISPILDDEPDRKEPDISGGFRGVRPEGRHQRGGVRLHECG